MEIKRVFDLLPHYKEKFPEQKVALAGKQNGKWREYSIDEYFERRLVKCEEEAFAYAKSIVERYGRRPKVSDFYEEFPLFVDSHNIDEYIDVLPIRRQLDVYYDRWIKNHKAKYDGFEEFLTAAGIN